MYVDVQQHVFAIHYFQHICNAVYVTILAVVLDNSLVCSAANIIIICLIIISHLMNDNVML